MTAAQPTHVAAGPCVWWPRSAETALERVVINTSQRQKPEKEIVLSRGNARNADLETAGVDECYFKNQVWTLLLLLRYPPFLLNKTL